MDDERQVGEVVARARARLGRVAGRALLFKHGRWVVAAGVALALTRPLVWPLRGDVPLTAGLPRAALLFAAGALVTAIALMIAGRLRRPSPLGAARALDEALGLDEVIASGHAFAEAKRDEPVALLARERATKAARGADVPKLFPLPSMMPRGRVLAGAALALVGALSVGAYDPALVAALAAPPTGFELDAAQELDRAAASMDPKKDEKKAAEAPSRDRSTGKSEALREAMAAQAKDAARAAKRGDRKGALDKLDAIRNAGEARSAEASALRDALKRVAEALARPSNERGQGKSGRPQASEEMRLLADKMRSQEGSGLSKEEQDRVLERLERAADEASRAMGKNQDASRAAQGMKQAAAALSRGDREAAASLLAQAIEHMKKVEAEREAASNDAKAVMEMLERAGLLERAVQAALVHGDKKGEGAGEGKDGKDGKDGKGKGEGSDGKDGEGEGQGQGKGNAQSWKEALAARLAVLGLNQKGDPSPGGTGGHIPNRGRSKRDPIDPSGSIKAHSQVGEGQRAIQAIQGLGKGSEPPASYREVFPSYDAAVEEGLADERIPAARRRAVRRYFETIRPGSPGGS